MILQTGRLRVSTFNAKTVLDLKAAISELEQSGARSYFLDLRDNRGGLVSERLEVASLFLEGPSLSLVCPSALPLHFPPSRHFAVSLSCVASLIACHSGRTSVSVSSSLRVAVAGRSRRVPTCVCVRLFANCHGQELTLPARQMNNPYLPVLQTDSPS